MIKKTAVLFSGSGVYDGTEIHESVCALLALKQNRLKYLSLAPNIQQCHVINHLNGQELKQERNVLEESSRIVRGNILSLEKINYDEINSLLIPGGFGAVKNLSDWAFNGRNCRILPEVKNLILHCIENKKPIVSLCISPILIAKSLEGTKYKAKLTLGSTKEKSPYNIQDMHKDLNSLGAETIENFNTEISIDEELKIIIAPCYMMKIGIDQVYQNIKKAVEKLAFYLN